MPTIRLVPSTYAALNSSGSSVTYLSVDDTSKLYNNTDSTTYATISNTRTSTTAYYFYLRGFNFSDVPTGSTINSITIKVKTSESGLSTTNTIQLMNDTTTLGYTVSAPSTTVTTSTFSSTPNWDTLSGYGSNFGIRIAVGRSSRNTPGYLYFYGCEILVDYTLPYTVTTTITNGTVVSDNPMTVAAEDTALILFNGDDGCYFKSMTVNGNRVIPSKNEAYEASASGGTATLTYSTNYSEYQTYYIANAFDGDSSSCFWSSEAQAAGKYILMNFDKEIDLTSFSASTTGSTTDYICSGAVLQVSMDNGTSWEDIDSFNGTATQSFSNLNKKNINAIRIYWNSGVDYWLYINEITITYTDHVDDYQYIYAISNINNDVNVIIIFAKEKFYVKIDNSFSPIYYCYQKIDDVWTEIEYTYDSSKKLKYLGKMQ